MRRVPVGRHPDWRRCSSLEYPRYARSSRLASRAPRSDIHSTNDKDRPLARRWRETAARSFTGRQLVAKRLKKLSSFHRGRVSRLRNRLHERRVEPREVFGRLQIDRLAQIVGRRVVSLRPPALDDLVLRRAQGPSDLERERRDAAADEAVLIAAHEARCARLGIARDSIPAARPPRRRSSARSDSSRPLHDQRAHREERQEHVRVEIGHERRAPARWGARRSSASRAGRVPPR